MKKILMVIPSLVGGGAERVMTTLANGLSEDYDVEILTISSAETFYKLNNSVKVSTLGRRVNRKNSLTLLFTKIGCAISGFFGMYKAVKQKNPHTIIAFLGTATFPLTILRFFGLIKCRLIVSERADPTVRGGFYKWFERTFFPKADVIVCQGQRVEQFFKVRDRKKCVVIPNPICAEAIPPLYNGNRRKCIVGVGRLASQKNFTMLINAFSKLPEEFSEYKLEIYGMGPMQSALEKQIESLSISDRATLMGVQKNVMFSVADATLYVMSSDYEGFPNALAEAMATGLPVISTDFPTGVASEIVGADNGIVIPIGDENALLCAMVELLSDEERREKMSLENRKCLDTFSEDVVLKMWKEVI